MKLNKEFIFSFQPYEPEKFNNRRRFGVSANTLFFYIGEDNAKTVFEKAKKMQTDKMRLKFRTKGVVDVYNK